MADNILLMTKRPTQIAEIVKFNSIRPRKATIFADPEFIQIKFHCLEVFQKEVRR